MQIRWLYGLFAVLAASLGYIVFQSQQYDFTTLDGRKHKHSDYHGQYLVVNYFAEWCAPCLKEVPELSRFNQIKPYNTQLFAISYDNLTDEKLKAIKEKYNMQFDLINKIDKPFPFDKPEFLPATYILNPDGSLKGQLFGEQTAENLLSVLSDSNSAAAPSTN
uniref:TlpA family protein disulfide reductase n=1 Tax=Ningiella ruwaisensis TaxID=2364274 RepID=UPI00109F1E08|nr:TlpA disulfide reductase family protein [Ningiella ruwaisensis]